METGLGKRIKKRRTDLHLTQEELAHRMGYKSKAAICKVEGGEDNITSDRIQKFADALETTPSYLMGWEENPTDINEEAGKLYSAYAFRVLYDSLPLEEQEKINEIEKQLVNLTPENRTLILNLLKSLLPDA